MTQRWIALAAGLALFAGSAAGQPADPEAEPAPAPILDERGWLTCRAFVGMSAGLQSAFLMGLREGWQTSSGILDANAGRSDLPPVQRATIRENAVYMRRLIDHQGVTYGQMLERTRQLCERQPDASASLAWLEAIKVSRGE